MEILAEKPETALRHALRASRMAFVAVCFFSFFLNLLFLTSPLYMLQVYDRVLASGRHETLFYLTLMAVFALIIFGMLEGLRQAMLSRIGSWLHNQVGDAVISASVQSTIGNKPIGGQGLRDLQSVQSFVGSRMIVPFFDSPWAPIFVGIIWMLHPALGTMALISALTLFGIAVINDIVTRKPLAQASTMASAAQREAERALVNSETIQAMGMLPAVVARWRARSDEAQAAMAPTIQRSPGVKLRLVRTCSSPRQMIATTPARQSRMPPLCSKESGSS
jgi:ATP-binding cassette subfamily C protein/ATP-binding cassette subfamily C exporter for protease/lipase/ATP-binding cassette subfamily C protein EexD